MGGKDILPLTFALVTGNRSGRIAKIESFH